MISDPIEVTRVENTTSVETSVRRDLYAAGYLLSDIQKALYSAGIDGDEVSEKLSLVDGILKDEDAKYVWNMLLTWQSGKLNSEEIMHAIAQNRARVKSGNTVILAQMDDVMDQLFPRETT